MALENPPVFEHGFVTGRYVTAVADTRNDPDRYPDLQAIAGQMNFMPLQEVHLKGGEHPATVVKQEISIGINSQGYVADEQSMDLPAQIELTEEEFEELSEEERIAFEEHNLLNRPGVYLAVGLYRVRPVFRGVRNVPEFEIRVTAEHTKESPLDLTLHAPLTPPPGFTEVVRVADRILAEEAAEAAQRFRDETEAFAQTDQFLLYIQEAESARDTARGHAETADAHRVSAGEYAGQAGEHATEAHQARDGVVEARDEARGYSESASASADSANTSLNDAKDQVTEATGQADRSKSEADRAAGSALEAESSHQGAAQEATNASQSATDAQESATTASGHAEAAEIARGAAEGHATDAQGYATTAGEHAQSVGGVVEEAKGHADRAESASDSAETHREGAETAYSQAQDLIENLSPTDFPVATPESRGFMSPSDKRKLDGSTSEADPNSIVERDDDGVFSVADPTDDSHVTNKGYVDASIQEHTPDLPDNLATEEYVDTSVSELGREVEGAWSGLGENVIEDPSFESDYWFDEFLSVNGTRTYTPTAPGRTGGQAMEISEGSSYYLNFPSVDVTEGQTWRMTVWYRTSGSPAMGLTQLRLRERVGSDILERSAPFVVSEGRFRCAEMTFTVPPGVGSLTPAVFPHFSGGILVIDDISFQQISPAIHSLEDRISRTSCPSKAVRDLAVRDGWSMLFDPTDPSSVDLDSDGRIRELRDSIGGEVLQGSSQLPLLIPGEYGQLAGMTDGSLYTGNLAEEYESPITFFMLARNTSTDQDRHDLLGGAVGRRMRQYVEEGSWKYSQGLWRWGSEADTLPHIHEVTFDLDASSMKIDGQYSLRGVHGGSETFGSISYGAGSADHLRPWVGSYGLLLAYVGRPPHGAVKRMQDLLFSLTGIQPGIPDFYPELRALTVDGKDNIVLAKGDPDMISNDSVASMTKMIVALAVRKYVPESEMDDTITIESGDAFRGPPFQRFQAGDEVSWRNLIYAMAMPSDNDAAGVFARVIHDRYLSADYPGFTPYQAFLQELDRLLNEEFDCKGAMVRQATGGARLSGRQVARILRMVLNDPILRECFGARTHQIEVEGPNSRTIDLTHTIHNGSTYMAATPWISGKTGSGGYYVHVAMGWDHPSGEEYITVIQEMYWDRGGDNRYIEFFRAQDSVLSGIKYIDYNHPAGAKSAMVQTTHQRDITDLFEDVQTGSGAGAGIRLVRTNDEVTLTFDRVIFAGSTAQNVIPREFRPSQNLNQALDVNSGEYLCTGRVLTQTGRVALYGYNGGTIRGTLKWSTRGRMGDDFPTPPFIGKSIQTTHASADAYS